MTGLSRELVSVIYSSRAAREFTPDDLDRLLLNSRQRNETTELSGLLLYRSGTFLQLLEGPRKAVWQRFSSIERDPRHTEVVVQSAEPIDQRMFGHWAMAHPGAPRVISTRYPDTGRSSMTCTAPRRQPTVSGRSGSSLDGSPPPCDVTSLAGASRPQGSRAGAAGAEQIARRFADALLDRLGWRAASRAKPLTRMVVPSLTAVAYLAIITFCTVRGFQVGIGDGACVSRADEVRALSIDETAALGRRSGPVEESTLECGAALG